MLRNKTSIPLLAVIFWVMAAICLPPSEQAEDDCGPKANKACEGKYKDFCCHKTKLKCMVTDDACSKEKGCDEEFGDKWGRCQIRNKCGPKVGRNCTGIWDGQCCSKMGICGDSRNHDNCKLENCDPKYGRCGLESDCGPKFNKKCTYDFEDYCCSKDGKCGLTDEFCSPEKCNAKWGTCGKENKCGMKAGKKCTGKFEGECCSKTGICGMGKTASEACKNSNCDKDFGPCGHDVECGPKYNKKCTGDYEGQCCSKKGRCGTKPKYYCGKDVCDPNWGKCPE